MMYTNGRDIYNLSTY